jgi:hypothetical protein
MAKRKVAAHVGRWFYAKPKNGSGKFFVRKTQNGKVVGFDIVSYDGPPKGGRVPTAAMIGAFSAWRPRGGKIMFAIPAKQLIASSRFKLVSRTELH